MIGVFLVEDEFVIREGMKKNIAWEANGMRFLGEAADGELAYPQIQKLKPDIIITDIKMPFMDGIELSALVKKELPKTKIIILSGYGDFGYAKQAIGIGVTDYLLKPISPDKLLEAVKKVRDIISKEQEKAEYLQRFEQEMQENKDLARSRYFDNLVSGKLSFTDMITEGRKLGLELTAACFRIVLFQISDEKSEEGMAGYSENVVRFMERLQEEKNLLPGVYMFPRGIEGAAFLLKADSEEELTENTKKLFDTLIAIREAAGGLRYFGAIGSTARRPKEIADSFASARKVFVYRYLGQKNRIVQYDETGKFAVVNNGSVNFEDISVSQAERNSIPEFLKNGLLSEAESFFENYISQTGEKNFESLMFRQYVAMDIYFCVCNFLKEIGCDEGEIHRTAGDVKELPEHLTDLPGVKAYLASLIKKAIEARDGRATTKYNKLIESAKKYIDENYAKEEISLNVTAESVNLSPNHFSTIFSQETGHTFIEYLTELRMNEARRLLRCTDMRMSEIADKVGYQDAHYFSYLFRKINSCSPREYREKR